MSSKEVHVESKPKNRQANNNNSVESSVESSVNSVDKEQQVNKWQKLTDEAAERQAYEKGLEHPEYQELQQKLNEAEQKANEHWNKVLRLQAELENTRRRAEKEKANAYKYAGEKLINELLPVLDSLETALQTDAKPESDKSLREGLELTTKMFIDVLAKFGVQQINPLGEAFDPTYHEALSMQASDSVPSGHVVSVIQKGYLLNERLIRPARVMVAK